MENSTRHYSAPAGMSPFGFNPLVRRRNSDDLIEMLRGKGILHRQIAGAGLANVVEEAAQTPTAAWTTRMAANVTVGSPVNVVAESDGQPRPASSVYSRDVDGNSYRSASTVQGFSSRSASFGSLLPPLVSLQDSGESSSSGISVLESTDPDKMFPAAVEVSDRDWSIADSSVSCSSWASVASIEPAPLNVPKSGEYGDDSRRSPASAETLPMTVEPRTPDRKSNSNSTSSASSASVTNSSPVLASQGASKGSSSNTSLSSPVNSVPSSATSASNIETASKNVSDEEQASPRRFLSSAKKTLRSIRSKLRSLADSSTSQVGQQSEDDPRPTLLELQQRYKQQEIGLRGVHPDPHHLIASGGLRREICSLDFDVAEMVLVVSDMMTCMQVPPVHFWGDRAHLRVNVDLIELAYEKYCQEYYRERLSRRVQCRIKWLERQARYGSVRKIEDWYREVVDAIGWRDEEEARLPWGWRERDNYL